MLQWASMQTSSRHIFTMSSEWDRFLGVVVGAGERGDRDIKSAADEAEGLALADLLQHCCQWENPRKRQEKNCIYPSCRGYGMNHAQFSSPSRYTEVWESDCPLHQGGPAPVSTHDAHACTHSCFSSLKRTLNDSWFFQGRLHETGSHDHCRVAPQ